MDNITDFQKDELFFKNFNGNQKFEKCKISYRLITIEILTVFQVYIKCSIITLCKFFDLKKE